jgi:hypothetical protein
LRGIERPEARVVTLHTCGFAQREHRASMLTPTPRPARPRQKTLLLGLAQ